MTKTGQLTKYDRIENVKPAANIYRLYYGRNVLPSKQSVLTFVGSGGGNLRELYLIEMFKVSFILKVYVAVPRRAHA